MRPYQGYVYAYPHKSAYRALTPPRRLADVWRDEPKDSLFLYLHLPFCEMRCGFCNLFTMVNPKGDLIARYLSALRRETEIAAAALGDTAVAQLAIGGGTPTFLPPEALDATFAMLRARFAADPSQIPSSIETSPKTATEERLAILAAYGFERISIGAQSFIEAENKAMGRPQATRALTAALDRIRATPAQLNIDLIYGAPGQTAESWLYSLRRALEWRPEEIFLYPLYVRPKTGLAGRAEVWDAERLALYRAGRDHLIESGYTQFSMRHFRRMDASSRQGSNYCCQEDGMLGLGAGARSYTSALHYSSDYAVDRRAVLSIIEQYCQRDEAEFGLVRHGVALDRGEQMLRDLLKSIFRTDGLDRRRFLRRHGLDPLAVSPSLSKFIEDGYFTETEAALTPTERGLEFSDGLGPQLFSEAVKARMDVYEPV